MKNKKQKSKTKPKVALKKKRPVTQAQLTNIAYSRGFWAAINHMVRTAEGNMVLIQLESGIDPVSVDKFEFIEDICSTYAYNSRKGMYSK